MEFEWDEQKRRANIEKHGTDFLDADLLFTNPNLEGLGKTLDGERRCLAIGKISEIPITAIFTERGETIRLISIRRARHGKRKRHQERFNR